MMQSNAKPLDPKIIKGVTLRPDEGPNRGVQPVRNERSWATLAKIQPATDAEAGEVTLPALGLLDVEVDRIRDLATLVTESREAFTEAEAALAKATHEARRLLHLKAQAGEVAARAFTMNGAGVAAASEITTKIDKSELAQSALPVLQRIRDQAFEAMGEARGALRRETVTALEAALKRAAERYNAQVIEITRTVAAMDAALHALPPALQEQMGAAWDVSFLPSLCLPSANPFGATDRGVVELNFRSSALANEHPRFSAHRSAARSWLHQQVGEAVLGSGIDPSRLLA